MLTAKEIAENFIKHNTEKDIMVNLPKGVISDRLVKAFMRHSTERDYIQRMTHEMWRNVLLADKDWTVYKEVKVKLFARNIGYGVVEVSKKSHSKNEGSIFG